MDFKRFETFILPDLEFIINNYSLWILIYCSIINVVNFSAFEKMNYYK